jgi:carotenoid cleavage dioxygenase-like enzyme
MRVFERMMRRHFLQALGSGAVGVAAGPFLTGCGDDAGSDGNHPDAAAAGDAGRAPPTGLAYDPSQPFWLQNNFAPLADEPSAMALEIEGSLPPELNGLYVRNGSNAMGADNEHWFVGDGMLHGLRLQAGKALWSRGRYVQTEVLGQPSSDPPGQGRNQSNVSVVSHAGKLLSLGEVGFPYQVSPQDLSTLGVHDFGGQLKTWFTAHPKLDPKTGELLAFGYDFSAPFLTYHRIDAQGALVKSEALSVAGPSMMHEFAITEHYAVFLDLPILFDLDSAIAGEGFPFRWSDDYQAALLILPRDGTAADLKKIEIDPCFIFHTMNAHEAADGRIVLDAARHPSLWRAGPSDFDSRPALHRYEIDVAAGTATHSALDDRMVEFPQLDRRKLGSAYRYGYAMRLDEQEHAGVVNGMGGVVKYDHDKGTSQLYETEPGRYLDEAYFVPASASAGEDEGYLVGYEYDLATDKSALYVLDASAMKRVARVKLPYRVPFGFHGLFVPDDVG